jgi:hypothetical protein
MSNYHQESVTPTYPAQVTEWQTSDDVLGGTGGKANEPILQIVERTRWLKFNLDSALTTIANILAGLTNVLLRISAIESLLPNSTINAIQNINNADNLTTGTVAVPRLPKSVRISVTRQTGLAILPDAITHTINFNSGGIIDIELRNTAPCALSFHADGLEPGASGEIHFTSIFGTSRVVQLPAAAPRWEVAAPDTRNITVSNKPRVLAWRVLDSGLVRATLIRDFA